MNGIFGFTCMNDVTARDLTKTDPSYMRGKGFDTFGPLGPWIVTAGEIENPMKLRVQQWNNGELTHDYNTDDMAHDIAASLAFVSATTTLEAGDVIALGTNHQGLHPLQRIGIGAYH